jgi:hypothetical protein
VTFSSVATVTKVSPSAFRSEQPAKLLHTTRRVQVIHVEDESTLDLISLYFAVIV